MSFQSTIQHIKYFRQSPTCGFPTSADTQCITDSLLPGWMKEDNVGKEASVKKRNAGWQDRGRGRAGWSLRKSTWISQLSGTWWPIPSQVAEMAGIIRLLQKDRVWQVCGENTAESFLIFAPTHLHSHCQTKWKTQIPALRGYKRSLPSLPDCSQVTCQPLLYSRSLCAADLEYYTSFSPWLI